MPSTSRGGLHRRAERTFVTAMEENLANIEQVLASVPAGGSLLDLGCDDGTSTLEFATAARASSAHGIEIVKERARLAAERGVDVRSADLNGRFPFADETFDVVVSNMVIEHLTDTDAFVSETYRVLKPSGCAVTSTENLASWHNIASLLLGWQPFSLTNVSRLHLGLGNPLALHRGQRLPLKSWEHLRVFAYRGLRELFTVHGFTVESVLGAGYYPLPRRLARLDPRHAAFLTVKAVRPERPAA
jgi:SAM-dependent methyltransferase